MRNPTHVSLEAEDAPYPSGGSSKDETDPMIEVEDRSEDQSDKNASEDESPIEYMYDSWCKHDGGPEALSRLVHHCYRTRVLV